MRPLPRGLFHNDFSLPQIGLADAQSVLDGAVSDTRLKSVEKSLLRPQSPLRCFDSEDIDRAKARFAQIAASFSNNTNTHSTNTNNTSNNNSNNNSIPVESIASVLAELHVTLDDKDLSELRTALDVKPGTNLLFADIVEIAAFMQSEYQQHFAGHDHLIFH